MNERTTACNQGSLQSLTVTKNVLDLKQARSGGGARWVGRSLGRSVAPSVSPKKGVRCVRETEKDEHDIVKLPLGKGELVEARQGRTVASESSSVGGDTKRTQTLRPQ